MNDTMCDDFLGKNISLMGNYIGIYCNGMIYITNSDIEWVYEWEMTGILMADWCDIHEHFNGTLYLNQRFSNNSRFVTEGDFPVFNGMSIGDYCDISRRLLGYAWDTLWQPNSLQTGT
jgi:hypothetical protein